MIKFVKQDCVVRTTMQQRLLPVMVGVDSGLGYVQVPGLEQGYHLIHVRSGWYLCCGPQTTQAARQWIERIASLTDWTQDEQVIQVVSEALRYRVAEIRDEVAALQTRRCVHDT